MLAVTFRIRSHFRMRTPCRRPLLSKPSCNSPLANLNYPKWVIHVCLQFSCFLVINRLPTQFIVFGGYRKNFIAERSTLKERILTITMPPNNLDSDSQWNHEFPIMTISSTLYERLCRYLRFKIYCKPTLVVHT